MTSSLPGVTGASKVQPIDLRKRMENKGEWWIVRLIRWLLGYEYTRLADIAKIYAERTDWLKVKFDVDSVKFNKQKTKFEDWLKLGQELGQRLEKCRQKGAKETAARVYLSAASLLYRIEECNGGESPRDRVSNQLLQQLSNEAQGWKKRQPYPKQDRPLSSLDHTKLGKLARFPAFAKAFLKNSKLTNVVFSLVIRENFPIEALVRFWGVCLSQLKGYGKKDFFIACRPGFFKHVEMMRIAKRALKKADPAGPKILDLQLMIEDRYRTILQDNIPFQGSDGQRHTFKDVKEDFARTKFEPAKLEMYEQGGICYIPVQRELYDVMDVSQREWYLQAGWRRFVTMTTEEIEERYRKQIRRRFNSDKLPANYFLFTLEAAVKPSGRKFIRRNFTDAHSYLKIIIPDKRADAFDLYAQRFPQGLFALIAFLAATVKAELTRQGPNDLMSSRIHVSVPFFVPMDLLDELMTFLVHDKDSLTFQFAYASCGSLPQKVAEYILPKIGISAVPKFFERPVLDSEAMPAIDFITRSIKVMPSFLQDPILHGWSLLLGSKRAITVTQSDGTRVQKSVDTSPLRMHKKINNPAELFRKVEAGEVDGVIYYGYG